MKRIAFAALALGALVTASAVQAQMPVKFGIAGGITLPTGTDRDAVDNGFNAQAMVGFGMIAMPMKIRADVAYHSFSGKEGTLLADLNSRVVSGTVNAIFSMGGIGVKPYLIGGVGGYNSKLESFQAETKFGINGGLGIQFGLTGISTFLEARYHNVFYEGESGAFIPITFGIMF